MKSPSLLASFRFAFEGITYALRTQRNFKIHCGITFVVVVAGLLLGLTLEQWAILAVVTGLVFQAELMNTALEAIVDHVSPEFHALAKVAKDCAAGAVFLAALIAVIVGVLILGPRLMSIFLPTR
jgi:diacylglycerol kinase